MKKDRVIDVLDIIAPPSAVIPAVTVFVVCLARHHKYRYLALKNNK